MSAPQTDSLSPRPYDPHNATRPDTAVRIAVVDDDDLFRESITANLADAGFDAEAYACGPDFLAAVDDLQPAVVLLDWKMPEMNGIDVLKALRDGGDDSPVIFLTVLSEQIYEEAALAGGAVDFVEKSRSFSIILKRIKMITEGVKGAPRSETGPAADVAAIGQLEINRKTQRALWRGEMVELTLAEFRILARLTQTPGEDVSYRDLYDQVHGENFVAGHGESGYKTNVRAMIKRIRGKFKAIDDEFDAIANYPGFGYKWDA
ncbi:MAG: response regulator transcription factor [Pseudomonadota bacterium]